MQFQEGQSDEASLKRWLDEKGVYKVLSEMKRVGTSLAVQWFRLRLPMVQSQVGELRSHVPHGQKTKKLNEKNGIVVVTNDQNLLRY